MWLLLSPVALGQPIALVPSSGVQPASIRLSEFTRLTLALEGPAPLRVELPDKPEELLAPESAAAWRIRPDGPAVVKPLDEGRERWERAYRLDKWDPAGIPAVVFAPVKVTAGTDAAAQEVIWPPVEVKVQTTVAANPEEARPVTGIEELAPISPPPPEAVAWWVAAALGAVFIAAVVLALVRRARAKPPVPPGEWAARELDRLEQDFTADRLAAVLRGFVERQHGLHAPKLTTTELLTECDRAGWPAERVAGLRELLERCDRAKFAGDEPAAAEAGELLSRARGWLAASSPAPYTSDT